MPALWLIFECAFARNLIVGSLLASLSCFAASGLGMSDLLASATASQERSDPVCDENGQRAIASFRFVVLLARPCFASDFRRLSQLTSAQGSAAPLPRLDEGHLIGNLLNLSRRIAIAFKRNLIR